MRRVGRQVLGLTVASTIGGAATMTTAAEPLERYRWQNRIIVVFADLAPRRAFDRQLALLAEDPDALAERDLIVVTTDDDRVGISGAKPADPTPTDLRRAYDVPPDRFAVLLIGKDGGVKLRSDQPVPLADVNALIDTMPMRRREMRSSPD